jgi:hypothetical protein
LIAFREAISLYIGSVAAAVTVDAGRGVPSMPKLVVAHLAESLGSEACRSPAPALGAADERWAFSGAAIAA